MKLKILIVVFGMCLSSYAQEINFSDIDTIMKFLSEKENPGCAIGVIKDGKLVYKKGFGYANTEKKIPVNSQTNFSIASNSKQFTAFCIFLLEEQGKLKRDDDIRKYIPEFPDYGKKITIRHLLHHSSGIRDWTELRLLLCEPKFNNSIKYPLKLLIPQKKLHFSPGEKIWYSNSNYYLLGLITERVSGMPFHKFIRKNIFEPLGMKNSYFTEEKNATNLATGYTQNAEQYVAVENNFHALYGEGGIISNMDDLFLWDQNFYHNILGKKNQSLIDSMEKVYYLSNGKETRWASGLQVYKIDGNKTVSHGGNSHGFATQRLQYPDQKISIMCLSNIKDFDYNKYSTKISTVFIKSKTPDAEQPGKKSPVQMAGTYFNSEDAWVMEIRKDSAGNAFTGNEKLSVENDSTYSHLEYWDQKTNLYFSSKGKDSIFMNLKGAYIDQDFYLLKADSLKKDFLGTYYCAELGNIKYELKKDKDGYYFRIKNKYNCNIVKSFGPICVTCANILGAIVEFKTDEYGKVSGFEISTDRAKKVKFLKK